MHIAGALEAMARGEVTARFMVETHLAAIDLTNPTVNAVIWTDPERALERAGLLDQGAVRGALHGIPLAHKDMFADAGALMTCGSVIRRDHRPSGKATVIARLDAAGAVRLGGLNMSEFAQGPTGHNPHHGDCRNPWNPAHIAGGSSSGSGAAVAAGMVLAALGSDTGGSIRIPASCCGVTGLKPTWSRVSRHGAMPLSFSMDCIGPIARSAADCARVLQVIAGPDPADRTSSAWPVPDYAGRLDGDLRGLRIGLPRNGFVAAVDPEVAAATEAALRVLEARGASLVPVDIPEVRSIETASAVVSRVELAACHAEWMRTRPGDYADSVSARMFPNYAIPAVHYLDALRRRGPLLDTFARAVFDRVDVLATPTLPMRVPTLAETRLVPGDPSSVQRFLSPSANTRLFSYLGLPAVSVPAGFDSSGLPIGLQIAGRPFAEATLLRAGDALQRDTDWHLRLPPLAPPPNPGEPNATDA